MQVTLGTVNADDLRSAKEAWRGGKPLDAGRFVYERLAVDDRPAWALGVLDACYAGQQEIPPEVQLVREIARDRGRWAEGHAAFQAVRILVLRNEKRATTATDVAAGLLYLVENVAKVTYSASGSPAPFDHDAGWWVASCARWVVEHALDLDLEARVWAALVAGAR
jgi:hypothetical protein